MSEAAMASSSKRARDSTGSNIDISEERRRREEKRRREDALVEEADARLAREARERCRAQSRARKLAEYVVTRARAGGNEDDAAEGVEEATTTSGGKRAAKTEEPRGPLNETRCPSCIVRRTECHARL